jgi:hypothetical protein
MYVTSLRYSKSELCQPLNSANQNLLSLTMINQSQLPDLGSTAGVDKQRHEFAHTIAVLYIIIPSVHSYIRLTP